MRKMKKTHPFLISLLLFTAAAQATDERAAIPFDNAAACMEGPLVQFGQYIGNWDIEDSRLSQETKKWVKGAGARWNFVCVGDGAAIQDFWLPNSGAVGTNLRIYNPDSNSWDVAWAVSSVSGFAHIEAKQVETGNIVMRFKTKAPTPDRRITFFPATENSWNWKLEITLDGGENWVEVYRIKASRSTD